MYSGRWLAVKEFNQEDLSMRIGKLSLVICTVAFFIACSDSVTEVVRPVETVVLGKADSLPECSPENQGQMAVISEDASAYVCENSKWENLVSKPDAEPCVLIALSDGSGYKIVCGEDTVGTVLNGMDGQNGAKGEQGKSGLDGRDCFFIDNANGTILQICGEDSTVLSKALCGGELYDPATHFCYSDRLYAQVVYDTLIDARDGFSYRTVKIGSQTWMADNLRFVTDSSSCLDDTLRCLEYGLYYKWFDMIDSIGKYRGTPLICSNPYGIVDNGGEARVTECNLETPARGICPEGWHIPTSEEWAWLFNTVDRMAYEGIGKVLKSRTGWDFVGGDNGIDLFGFDAKPTGAKGEPTEYGEGGWGEREAEIMDDIASFWAADFYQGDSSWCASGSCFGYIFAQLAAGNGMSRIYLSRMFKKVGRDYDREFLSSVRCVRDEQD